MEINRLLKNSASAEGKGKVETNRMQNDKMERFSMHGSDEVWNCSIWPNAAPPLKNISFLSTFLRSVETRNTERCRRIFRLCWSGFCASYVDSISVFFFESEKLVSVCQVIFSFFSHLSTNYHFYICHRFFGRISWDISDKIEDDLASTARTVVSPPPVGDVVPPWAVVAPDDRCVPDYYRYWKTRIGYLK